MQTRFEWLMEADGLFCSTAGSSSNGRRYMVVESLPDGGWDWVAWSDDGSRRCLHGRSQTSAQAVQAAEHGAELLRVGSAGEADERRASLQTGLSVAMS